MVILAKSNQHLLTRRSPEKMKQAMRSEGPDRSLSHWSEGSLVRKLWNYGILSVNLHHTRLIDLVSAKGKTKVS